MSEASAITGLDRARRVPPDAAPWPGLRADAAADPRTIDRQRDFSAVLSRRFDRPGQAADPEGEALDAARQLVSITLVQPLLAQLRATSTAAPPFAPTPAERQFRAMSDAHLAQEIVKAARFPLVDRLARDMLSRSTAGRAATTDMEVRT